MKDRSLACILLLFLLIAANSGGTVWRVPAASAVISDAPSGSVRFAVIGDYGSGSNDELAVANLVQSWSPDVIITVGDNNYPSGASSTIDQNIGQFYHEYIYPYSGGYGQGAANNKFFPTLGNHDWYTADAQPYLDYFALPNNERYYDFVWGWLHFFAIDSDPHEPDGMASSSPQATWLRNRLAISTSCWNIVYFHHAPYSSGPHGADPNDPGRTMTWLFQSWGADAVLAGHDHTYERIMRKGFPYFVNGLGGASRYGFGTPVSGSVVRYNAMFGAMRVNATDTRITYEFIATDGTIADTYTQSGGCAVYLPFVKK